MSSTYSLMVIALALLVVIVGCFALVALRRRSALAEKLRKQAGYLATVNSEMKAAEARLRAIVDSSLDAIITIGPESKILEWNRRAEEIFGWSIADATGRNLEETIIPQRYREAHRNGIKHYLATGEGPLLGHRVELSGLRRDGSEFPVELTIAEAGEGDRLIFSAFIRDITARRTAEQWAAAEHDIVRVMAESRTLEEAAPLVLQSMGEALGWDVGVFWVVDKQREFLRFVGQWHGSGQEVPEFAAADRETHFVPGMGLPGRVWGSRSPHWISNLESDVNFPRVHAAAREGLHSALGFPILSAGECLGVIEFLNTRLLTRDETLLQMLFDIGTGIAESMRRIQAEEGLATAMQHMEQSNAELERRRSEAERARALADEANRAKSDFLANMSHELRTPLNAIIGYADLLRLQLKGPLTEGQISQVTRIQNSSKHLLALIEDILDLSKIEAGRMNVKQESARVVDVVHSALTLVAPQAAERNINLRNNCDDDVRYMGDEHRVRQILLNLLSNAVKFTEPGGHIEISCGITESPDPDAGPTGDGPWIFVKVEDTGIGVENDEIAAIFEPFVQAETGHTRTRGGTGLGLTISRRLARLMGGDLTLHSERGVGSVFIIWLPSTVAVDQGADETSFPVSDALQEAGSGLLAKVDHVLEAVDARLRVDPLIPDGQKLDFSQLHDHQKPFLIDIAQSLVTLAAARRHPEVLRESSDVQHVVALRHGELRARLGWDARALNREFAILREEVAAAIHGQTPRIPDEVVHEVLTVVDRLIEAGCRLSTAALERIRDAE